MGLLRGIFGKAYIDSTGLTRDEFRRVGHHAATLFIVKTDSRNAALIINKFADDARSRFGDQHFDVGRACLLLGTFMGMVQNYDAAVELSTAARDILSPLGDDDFDYRASVDFLDRLEAAISNKLPVSTAHPLIDNDTDIGNFLMDLKP